jgi:hypothetical protein
MTYQPLTDPVDYILLAGRRSPGVASIENMSSPRKYDERKGYGRSGARVVFRGNGLAKPSVIITLSNVEDWANWAGWKDVLARTSGRGSRRAQDVWHPIFEDAGVNSVVIEDVLGPRQTADGEWAYTIRLIEYRPPVRSLATVDGSAADDAADPRQQQIGNLDGRVNALRAERARRQARAEGGSLLRARS